MDDLLTPVKTIKTVQSKIDRFESLSLKENQSLLDDELKPSLFTIGANLPAATALKDNTNSSESGIKVFKLQNGVNTEREPRRRQDSSAFVQHSYLGSSASESLPDDAREILRNQPTPTELLAVLQYLQSGVDGKHDFNVHLTSPKAAQIIHVLVTVTIPDHWTNLVQLDLRTPETQIRTYILTSLASVAGISGLLAQIRRLSTVQDENRDNIILQDTVAVLSEIIDGSDFLKKVLAEVPKLYVTDMQRRVLWQEFTALLGGSKILATMSQAFALSSSLDTEGSAYAWMGDKMQYSGWLARNISTAAMSLNLSEVESWTILAQLLKRGFSLGHRDTMVSVLYNSLLLGKRALWTPLQNLLQSLPAYEQKQFFGAMLRDLTQQFLGFNQSPDHTLDSNIGAVAALVAGLVKSSAMLEDQVVQCMTATSGEYAGLSLQSRRALMATLAMHQGMFLQNDAVLNLTQTDKLQTVLDKCMENFGDKLQIQHSSIMQQEATAQTILLTIGYLMRLNREMLKSLSVSSLLMTAVSNRLAASMPRARFLGMVVGVAVSKIVDKPDKVMNFGVEEMQGEEAEDWLALVNLQDRVGDIGSLKELESTRNTRQRLITKKTEKHHQRKIRASATLATSKIISIEEVDEEGLITNNQEDDDDLAPYAKPDDDPSDSDEDPTLINRSKPTAPVYINDLIRYLNSDDKLDVVELALKTAPSLIRRKADFGSEMSDTVQSLASALINLQDGMSRREVRQLRLESLIACLAAKPKIMGPWLASTYFEGDFSLTQRATLLSAIGLGSREIAGHKDSLTSQSSETDSVFPTKQLPSNLSGLYSPLTSLATENQRTILQPLALAAADKVSGPDILKIRTFSSRMAVEKRAAAKSASRSRTIPKDLHALLANSIYLPFACRLSLILSSSQTTLTRSTLFDPHILSLTLQTLTIVLPTLGPNTTHLPTLTRETLLLLTSLHKISRLAHDALVLPAILHLLLALLDLNIAAGSAAQEHLVTDFGTMLAELVSWAAGLGDLVAVPVIDAADAEGAGVGMPWTVLVAGIQVKWHEVGEKFQGRMLGLSDGDVYSF